MPSKEALCEVSLAWPTPGQSTLTRKEQSAARWRVFFLTWLGYVAFYLARKNLSVVKMRLSEELSVSLNALAMVDTAYLGAYALGSFAHGFLVSRFGVRRLLATTLLLAATSAVLFAYSTTPWVFALCFGLNGFCQAAAWVCGIEALSTWFPKSMRGKATGLWSTSYHLGGLMGTALATYLLIAVGWRSAFYVPGIIIALVGVVVWCFYPTPQATASLATETPPKSPADLPASPLSRPPLFRPAVLPTTLPAMLSATLPATLRAMHPARLLAKLPTDCAKDPAPSPSVTPDTGHHSRRASTWAVLCQPSVLLLSLSYAGVKLVRYSLLFWLPYYLHVSHGYNQEASGYLSTAFEIGGVAGALLAGWASDRWGGGSRLTIVLLLLTAISLGTYPFLGKDTAWLHMLGIAVLGMSIAGPDLLIAGVCPQELESNGTLGAGIISSIGTLGAMLQGLLTTWVTSVWGWDALFLSLMALALASALLLTPLLFTRRS